MLNTIPGNDFARYGDDASGVISLMQLDQDAGRLPQNFPLILWQEQSARYLWYWSWHRGEVLEEEMGKTKDGRTVYRYPLKLNPVRNFARKHAALLFGEVPDTPIPMVKTIITPKTIFADPTDTMKKDALFYASLVNEVWTANNGRSIQYENGEISQFLGGSVFQVGYTPWREDLLIPVTVKNIYPNFFLPIWSTDSYYDLLEAWVIYRIPAATAREMWNIEPIRDATSVLYAEHWTRKEYSITVDGKALEATYPNGMRVTFDHLPNPFGFVPFVYIPRLREGSYYGSSFIPDIAGLALEFNSRTADEGDAMRKTVQQRFKGSNITGEITTRKLDDKGNVYLDLGVTNPALDDPPELSPLDPPQWDNAYSAHKTFLWDQLLREAGLGPIAFGEDEGSQRSALTLAFRMWPSTVVAKAQRTFWTDGLNQVARYILRIIAIKHVYVAGKTVSAGFEKLYDIAPDWLPMIPRDREAQVNEIILRLQSNSISIEKALEDFGDVSDIKAEVDRIRDWATFMASLQAAAKGAAQDVVTPAASTGLRDQ